jgi:general stress protein 26
MATASKAQEQLSAEQHLANLRGIIDGARTVMLLSHGADGRIEGRPMALVKTDVDQTLYLTTSIESNKVAEIVANPQVSVTASHEGLAIIEGTARISQERALIDELWKDSWRAWYPTGKTDPTIAIIIVTPSEGTYWDMSMTTGLSYLYRHVKARLLGTEMELKPSDAAKVDLAKTGRTPAIKPSNGHHRAH